MKRIEEPKNMLGHVVGLIDYMAIIMLAGLLVILMAPVWVFIQLLVPKAGYSLHTFESTTQKDSDDKKD